MQQTYLTQIEICMGKQPVTVGYDLPCTRGLVKAAVEHTMIKGISAKYEMDACQHDHSSTPGLAGSPRRYPLQQLQDVA